MTHQKQRQILRIKSIYIFLKQLGMSKTSHLATEFGCTKKTIQNDMRILQENNRVKCVKPGIWKAI
ncbi:MULTISPECIES: DeoR family transcriptional regulator [Bacillus cereus group]|uniref:DeoR family transcriptional regulator n=1 Tax=Bacillus cereus group TaxID=86661 RepID=UPI0022E5A9A4|nr:HTH domain-containing protein [Bacillus cereus group sp. TH152-1LC]MDA1675137.1 DeoR family transcriptional regulator [Bacillus cereus group sp. TH152-1LC]